MKVNEKQVDAFEDIFLSTIKRISQQNEVITVVLADGTKYEFLTPEHPAVQFEKGETGDKGDSAYTVYQQGGGSLSVQEWIDSLKGETGSRGWRGYQGDRGDQGEPGADFVPVAGDIFLTDKSGVASTTLEGSKISLTIPDESEDIIDEEPLHLGKVTTLGVRDKHSVTLKRTGDDAAILLSFAKGHQGDLGDAAETAADAPDPTVMIYVNEDSQASIPSMDAKTQGNVWHFNIKLPPGKQGDSGDIKENSVNDKDISYLEIASMEGLINGPPAGSFMPIVVTLNNDICYGFSYRNGEFLTQTVWNSKGKRFTRKKTGGYVFPSVKTGWQEGG